MEALGAKQYWGNGQEEAKHPSRFTRTKLSSGVPRGWHTASQGTADATFGQTWWRECL